MLIPLKLFAWFLLVLSPSGAFSPFRPRTCMTVKHLVCQRKQRSGGQIACGVMLPGALAMSSAAVGRGQGRTGTNGGRSFRRSAAQREHPPRIAIVGSGLAGVSCTRELARLCQNAETSDQSSALKGAQITWCTYRTSKMATQMHQNPNAQPSPGSPFYDFGVQYFTASDPWFTQEVNTWSKLGLCKQFSPKELGVVSKGTFTPIECNPMVGCGGNGVFLTRLVSHVAAELSSSGVTRVAGFPDQGKRVIGISKMPDETWRLTMKNGESLGPFDVVVGAISQHSLKGTSFLSKGGPAAAKILQCLRKVRTNQLLAMQVYFDDSLDIDFSAAHVEDESSLSFVSNNCKRPHQDGRISTPQKGELWTLISTASFATAVVKANPKGYRLEAEKKMLKDFQQALGRPLGHYTVKRLNFWQDGIPMNTPPNSSGFLFDAKNAIGWCGDFCVSPNIQGAALSGRAAAAAIKAYVDGHRASNLPLDTAWPPMNVGDHVVRDIGAFNDKLNANLQRDDRDMVRRPQGAIKKKKKKNTKKNINEDQRVYR